MLKGKLPIYSEDIVEKKAKKEKEKNKKSNDEATLIIHAEAETMEKIRRIAYWERMLVKQVIKLAMQTYIKAYEATRGPLKVGTATKNTLLDL
jgi:hypothetical protein